MTRHDGCRFVPGFSNEDPPSAEPRKPADTGAVDYWGEHGGDMIPVALIDLVSVIARLRQVHLKGPDDAPLQYDRLFLCDMPRLEGYLPDEAREAIDR